MVADQGMRKTSILGKTLAFWTTRPKATRQTATPNLNTALAWLFCRKFRCFGASSRGSLIDNSILILYRPSIENSIFNLSCSLIEKAIFNYLASKNKDGIRHRHLLLVSEIQ